jgi:subtilisin family serine protease
MTVKFSRISGISALVLALPFFYFNCSGKFAQPSNGPGSAGAANVIPGDGNGNVVVPPGSTGTLQVFQDRAFSFTPASGAAGPFTISGLPIWATFDRTTGRVTGVGPRMSDTAVFNISDQGGKTFGPYAIQVVGNPLKEYQWHLKNTGQTAFALTPGVPGEDMHMANSLLAGYTGTGVRIAISDSGSVITHEALAANVLPGESRNYMNNFNQTHSWLGDPTPNFSKAEDAHGTATASLAVEKGWNGVGGRGVAPDAHFAAFLFVQAQDALAQNGLTTVALNDQFTGNFDVFNYSWGDAQCQLLEYPSTLNDKLFASVTQQRGGKGSLMLIAAGNSFVDDINSCFPNLTASTLFGNANFSEIQTNPYILSIAAVNAAGVSSSYSTPGSNLWVSAPGGEFGWDKAQPNSPELAMPAIVAADFPGCNVGMKTLDANNSAFDAGGALNNGCKYLSTMNGTSAATPIASGVVALLLQANPALTWRDVKYILAKTADKIDPNVNPAHHPATSFDLTGHVYDLGWVTNTAGFHYQNYYGFGRINVDNAVLMAKNFTSPLGAFRQTNWKHASAAINVAIPDNSAAGITQTMNVTDTMTLEGVQLRVSVSNCAGDLGLELTGPSGTKSIVMQINSRIQDGAILDHTFLSNVFYGEPSSGTWTLKVLDGHAGCTANLTNWKLNFFGY